MAACWQTCHESSDEPLPSTDLADIQNEMASKGTHDFTQWDHQSLKAVTELRIYAGVILKAIEAERLYHLAEKVDKLFRLRYDAYRHVKKDCVSVPKIWEQVNDGARFAAFAKDPVGHLKHAALDALHMSRILEKEIRDAIVDRKSHGPNCGCSIDWYTQSRAVVESWHAAVKASKAILAVSGPIPVRQLAEFGRIYYDELRLTEPKTREKSLTNRWVRGHGPARAREGHCCGFNDSRIELLSEAARKRARKILALYVTGERKSIYESLTKFLLPRMETNENSISL